MNSSGLGADLLSLPAECSDVWMSENTPVITVIICGAPFVRGSSCIRSRLHIAPLIAATFIVIPNNARAHNRNMNI